MTREVSQPEMSALKLRMPWKSCLMSVTPETHQPAMGPYFAVAAAAFELYSVAAVLREALSAKVVPVQAGGEGEGGGGEGEGGGGEGEGSGIRQQASLHFAVSDVFLLLLEHSLMHFFSSPPGGLHAFLTLFWSFFLQTFPLLSAAQSSGDCRAASALPLFIPGTGSIFIGVAEGWVSGGASAPTQFRTHNAASILAGRGALNLVRVAIFI